MAEGVPVHGDTTNAVSDVDLGERNDCSFYKMSAGDVFYTFMPSSDGDYLFTLTPDTSNPARRIDLSLRVFTDCPTNTSSCTPGNPHYDGVGGADDTEGGDIETLTVSLTGGQTYLVHVSGYQPTDVGLFDLVVDPAPTPPTNLTCATAELLTPTRPGDSQTINVDNSSSTSTLTSACNSTGPQVYYQFTLAAPSKVAIHVGSNFETPTLSLATSCPTAPSTVFPEFACAESDFSFGQGDITTTLPIGTYVLMLSATDPFHGIVHMTVDLSEPGPANDSCVSPAALSAHDIGDSVVVSGDSTDAGSESYGVGCGGNGSDVYYSLHLNSDSRLQATVTADDPDGGLEPVISLMTSCTGRTGVTCGSPHGGSSASVDYSTLPAGDYLLVVDSLTGPGAFSLGVSLEAPAAPPVNDNCAGVVDIPMATTANGTLAGSAPLTTLGADNTTTFDPRGDCSFQNPTGGDVVYRLNVPPGFGHVTAKYVRTDGMVEAYGVLIYLRQGPTCLDTSATEDACGYQLDSVIGIGDYYLWVDVQKGFPTANGTIEVTLR